MPTATETDRDEKFSFVSEIAADRAEKIADADQILEEIVRANRRASVAELGWFNSELHWNETQVRAEIRRMRNVLRLKSIAGTEADREAASVEAAQAEAVLQKEGPKISDQIDKLTARLSGLERDARLSAKRVEDQAEAVRQLRDHAPESVREAVRQAQSELDSTLGRRILDDQTRQNELQCCLDRSRYASEGAWLDTLKISCRDAITIGVSGGYQKLSLSDQWPSIRSAMESELAELNETIPQRQAELAARTAAIQTKLDHYTRGEKHDR